MRFIKWLIVVFVTVILGSCSFPSAPDNTVTIHGTVTITRNGIPWNNDNFPSVFNDDYRGAFSRALPPPQNPYHFSVVAYSASEMGRYIAYAWGDYKQSAADLTNGTYKWTMEIPSEKIPGSIIFKVSCRIEDNASGAVYPSKMMDAIDVYGENQYVSLGLIDFNILHLSGNLPISINGQPLNNEEYENAWLEVIYQNPYVENSRIRISPNGDWFFKAFVPDTLESLPFRVKIEKNNGIFKRVLNPDGVMTVLDTDQDDKKEILFPSYPSVDFEAFNMSGTIKFISLNPELYSDPGSIWFYDGDVDFYSLETLIADISSYGLQTLGDGLYSWQTMIPAFPIPRNLQFRVPGTSISIDSKYYSIDVTPSSAVINITDDTDLTNIHLGTFTSRIGRVYE
jgi:hypothetical protein